MADGPATPSHYPRNADRILGKPRNTNCIFQPLKYYSVCDCCMMARKSSDHLHLLAAKWVFNVDVGHIALWLTWRRAWGCVWSSWSQTLFPLGDTMSFTVKLSTCIVASDMYRPTYSTVISILISIILWVKIAIPSYFTGCLCVYNYILST